MKERTVRTTPQQELGHPSNKALEAISSYVNSEVFIRNLKPDNPDDKGLEMLIRETRAQHSGELDKLTPAETHFYHTLKLVLDKDKDEDINEDEIQGLERSGFSAKQVQAFLRLFNIYHPKDFPSSLA